MASRQMSQLFGYEKHELSADEQNSDVSNSQQRVREWIKDNLTSSDVADTGEISEDYKVL